MADRDSPIDLATAGPAEGLDPIVPAPAPPVSRRPRRWPRWLAMASVPLLLVGGITWYVEANAHLVSTDNAYVQQDKVSVSAELTGRIVAVGVRENQMVRKGDLLFRIDPEPYRIALQQADAAIAAAETKVIGLETDLSTKGADIVTARANLQLAQDNYRRTEELMRRGFSTRAQMDAMTAAVAAAKGGVMDAEGNQLKAKAALATSQVSPGINPAVLAAQAQRRQALYNLARTEVRAPADGLISQSSRLLVGNLMVQGLPAVSVVVSNRSWIEANYKETDLARMRVGQPATIEVDAYSGLKLKGHVASIGGGTGSEFSVLPAQNANGNWVKVTQRVPVRIAIDQPSPRPLIAGLSTSVTVDTAR